MLLLLALPSGAFLTLCKASKDAARFCYTGRELRVRPTAPKTTAHEKPLPVISPPVKRPADVAESYARISRLLALLVLLAHASLWS